MAHYFKFNSALHVVTRETFDICDNHIIIENYIDFNSKEKPETGDRFNLCFNDRCLQVEVIQYNDQDNIGVLGLHGMRLNMN